MEPGLIKEAPHSTYANAYIVRSFINDVPCLIERGFDRTIGGALVWVQVTSDRCRTAPASLHALPAAPPEILVSAAAAQLVQDRSTFANRT